MKHSRLEDVDVRNREALLNVRAASRTLTLVTVKRAIPHRAVRSSSLEMVLPRDATNDLPGLASVWRSSLVYNAAEFARTLRRLSVLHESTSKGRRKDLIKRLGASDPQPRLPRDPVMYLIRSAHALGRNLDGPLASARCPPSRSSPSPLSLLARCVLCSRQRYPSYPEWRAPWSAQVRCCSHD